MREGANTLEENPGVDNACFIYQSHATVYRKLFLPKQGRLELSSRAQLAAGKDPIGTGGRCHSLDFTPWKASEVRAGAALVSTRTTVRYEITVKCADRSELTGVFGDHFACAARKEGRTFGVAFSMGRGHRFHVFSPILSSRTAVLIQPSTSSMMT
jgi:hypothetical protein